VSERTIDPATAPADLTHAEHTVQVADDLAHVGVVAERQEITTMAMGKAHPEHHHRDVQGGAARAAVFGVSDGLVSNVALILAIAGAGATTATVRLAGLAGFLAGAISMAAGEYVSMRAQTELLERELHMERVEIARNPDRERRELEGIYRAKGVDATLAAAIATAMHSDIDRAVEAHAREELGIDPGSLGSPTGAALSSFAAFGVGALLPLLPWFFGGGSAALIATILLAALAATAVGIALASFTGRSRLRSAARQLAVAAIAAAITFGLGNLVGAGGLA
jgi:VIT1/CCC1 family predicted Fe2+/Mn2+ transporter